MHFFSFEGRLATGSALRRFWESRRICTNPATFVAGAYCCAGCSNIPPPYFYERDDGLIGNCVNMSDAWFTNSGCNIGGPGSWWDRNKWCEQRCDQLNLSYGAPCVKEYEEAHVCGYHQEHMSYDSAVRRCASQGLGICDGTKLSTCRLNDDNAKVWTQKPDKLRIRVRALPVPLARPEMPRSGHCLCRGSCRAQKVLLCLWDLRGGGGGSSAHQRITGHGPVHLHDYDLLVASAEVLQQGKPAFRCTPCRSRDEISGVLSVATKKTSRPQLYVLGSPFSALSSYIPCL